MDNFVDVFFQATPAALPVHKSTSVPAQKMLNHQSAATDLVLCLLLPDCGVVRDGSGWWSRNSATGFIIGRFV